MTQKSLELVVGQRYRIWYSPSSSHMTKRAFVGTYLGTDYTGDYLFNLRPEAGTMRLSHEQIEAFRSTVAKHRLPRRVEDIPSVAEDESTGYSKGG